MSICVPCHSQLKYMSVVFLDFRRTTFDSRAENKCEQHKSQGGAICNPDKCHEVIDHITKL